MKRTEAILQFPEVEQVLQNFHDGRKPEKPRKFYEELTIIACPAEFLTEKKYN